MWIIKYLIKWSRILYLRLRNIIIKYWIVIRIDKRNSNIKLIIRNITARIRNIKRFRALIWIISLIANLIIRKIIIRIITYKSK